MIHLENAEKLAAENPRTFSILSSQERDNLEIGQCVKLCFTTGASNPTGERMWVEITDVLSTGYIGKLRNNPMFMENLSFGDTVTFGPEHIFTLEAG